MSAAAAVGLACSMAGAQGAVLLDETFDEGGAKVGGANRDRHIQTDSTEWYVTCMHEDVLEPAPELVTYGQGAIAGQVLRFFGTSSNSGVTASFPAVTLDATGDYIEASFDFAYQEAQVMDYAPGSFGLQFGLFSSEGTPVEGNLLGNGPAADDDDLGYRVFKNPKAETDDLVLVAQANNPSGLTANFLNKGLGGKDLKKSSTGILAHDNTASHEVRLRIERISGEKLQFTYSFDGYEEIYTTSGSSEVMTFSFDQILINIGNNSSNRSYVDNIRVTAEVSQP